MWRILLPSLLSLLLPLSVTGVDYADQDNWAGVCTTGDRQTPIQIDPHTKNDPTLKPLRFHNYDKSYDATVTNDGKSLDITLMPDGSGLPTVYGGAEGKDKFRFAFAHLHWGTSNYFGSEHRIGDRQYAGEIHIGHYNTQYDTITEAIDSGKKNALLVIAFFFKVTTGTPNPTWAEIIDLIQTPGLTSEGDTTTFMDLAISDLMPSPRAKEFYHYRGSLTTPTCDEIVSWYVYEKTVAISDTELMLLRTMMKGGAGAADPTDPVTPITPNYRFTQPLNYRKVRAHRVGTKAGHGHKGHGPKGYGLEVHGPKGYGPKGFGPLFGPKGYGSKGYGPKGYGPKRFGPKGYGPKGYGPKGYGPKGYGPKRFGPKGYGPKGYGPKGYGPKGYGPKGYGPKGYGPKGYGPKGHGPKGYGSKGYGPKRYGPY